MNKQKCHECDQIHEVPDIEGTNNSLPWWPENLSLFRKLLCLFGYHKFEERRSCPNRSVCPNLKLRSQCKYCLSLD